MGTMADIEIVEGPETQFAANEAFNAAFDEIRKWEHALGIQMAEASPLRASATMTAEKFRDATGGAFDPTIGSLTLLWKFNTDSPEIPLPSAIERALRNTSRYDFGGIGKGIAAEEAARVLKANGVVSALVNLGGNIQAVGAPQDKPFWRIGIVHPRRSGHRAGHSSEASEALGYFNLFPNGAAATSGDYERYVMGPNGKRYHHILDPLTGWPAERSSDGSKLISVTIISPSATTADAWSTGAFVLGWPDGFDAVEKMPDLDGIFVLEAKDGSLRIKTTSGVIFDAQDDPVHADETGVIR